jgi:hypothetical protein
MRHAELCDIDLAGSVRDLPAGAISSTGGAEIVKMNRAPNEINSAI